MCTLYPLSSNLVRQLNWHLFYPVDMLGLDQLWFRVFTCQERKAFMLGMFPPALMAAFQRVNGQ